MLPRRFNPRKIAAWLGQTEAYAEQKPGKIAGVLRKGMELVGQTGYTVINAADEAAMGAGTGAVAGALLAGSPTLGLGAAPGAISGAVAGGGIGLKAGMAKEVFAMEAGYAYHELKSMGVDDQPAKQIAIAVGAINAAIEFAQIGTLLKGLGKAVPTGYVSRLIARKMVERGAVGKTVAALAFLAADVAKATAQELAQESVAIGGTELGAKIQGVNGLGKEQIAARLKDTALSSALGFLFLNIPGAVYGAYGANLPGQYAAGTRGGEGESSVLANVPARAGKKIKAGSFDELPSSAKNSYKGYEGNGWKGNYSGQAPGTNAGRVWDNEFNDLPPLDRSGQRITYREFDVNNRVPGAGRGTERFLGGSDGSVYYTPDHYSTFIRIK